ncbi:MAG: site-specific integrase [Halobacteriovoraceae bacterium]|nr:site-specific integrase [Halobacteriovoraceae bacterium]|tara:strand:- start:16540 stop:17586 length:1047 start_codon:yes stop_codon:yes gene_type:complete
MGIKYNEAKKYYEVSYSRRHPLTKQSRSIRRVGIRTKGEAQKVFKQIKNELLRKFYDMAHPYWAEVVERFITHFVNSGMANNTVINYKTTLRAHTFEKWKFKRINEITTSEIRDFILEDLASYSEAHRKNMLKYLRAVFRFAIENDFIQRDPCPRLKFKRNEKIKKVLVESQIKTLLTKAKEQNHPWFPIWALACYTGMRNGELYALRWERVDLEKRVMVVCESWTKENGFKDTKSGDDRSVEIALSLMPLFDELHKDRRDEFVLPRLKNWISGGQSQILKSFLDEISLPVIRFHDLRASWATVMLSKGVEPIKVMAMGGWKDLKTMQIYIRKSGIHIQGITNDLNFL